MWHYVNSTSSPAAAAVSSQECSSDMYASAPANWRKLLEKSYYSDNVTESFHGSQSGTTSAPSTGQNGKEALTSSAADSHVKTSQSPTLKPQESQANAPVFGLRWPESYLKFDRSKFSWKTHPNLFPEDSDSCSPILPRWGIMQNGVLSAVVVLETWLRARDFGCSLLRPTASDGLRYRFKLKSLLARNKKHADGNLTEQLARRYQKLNTPECAEILMRWPPQWTDLRPLEMVNFQTWLRSHSEFCATNSKQK